RKGGVTELNGRRIDIAGTFTLGPNFRADGNLLMSDRNFRRYGSDPGDPTPATDRVEFGLLKLRDGARSEAVLARLAAALPPDVRVVSKEEFIRQVRRFWAANQPVGTVFGLGMIVGFVIGVAICYQILFTDISNHQAEF